MTLHYNQRAGKVRDQLSVRLPRELNVAVAERAKREARRPSDIVRLALQAYLQNPVKEPLVGGDRVREGSGSHSWGEVEKAQSERTIILRQVPEELYQALKTRASRERLSVADYVQDILARRQFRERLASRPRVELSVSAADLIREGRDGR